MSDPQTYWKKTKVPADLIAAGWQIEKRDSIAPFALVNETLELNTGGYPDAQQAIDAARDLQTIHDEEKAIATEGSDGDANQERPAKLPIALVDEGWRLHRKKGDDGFKFYADRTTFHGSKERSHGTTSYSDPADAVAEAIKLEAARQADIEARETGGDVAGSSTSNEEQKTVTTSETPNGNAAPPAELLLELARLRLDGETQQRALFDQTVVEDYVEQMAREEFPPVDVFFDGDNYWLADGFYRVRATQQLDRPAIKAHVRQGSQRDAILFSLGANARHGLRRTPDDKRRAVLAMLNDAEWAAWSDSYIAAHVRVSTPFVRKLRRQETAAAKEKGDETTAARLEQTKRIGRDQRVQETKRIGKADQRDEEEAQLRLVTPPTSPEEAAPEQRAEKQCSVCDRPLDEGDYQNAAGECWTCDSANQKKPRKKTDQKKDQKTEPAPALPDLLRKAGELQITLLWSKVYGANKVRVIVSAAHVNTHLLKRDQVPTLPEALLKLIAADLQERAPTKEKTRTTDKASAAKARRKPTKLAKAAKTKAPAKKTRSAGKVKRTAKTAPRKPARPAKAKTTTKRRANKRKG